jgi:MinD-like ATPase involved in chromosome partitioning or flagellar assembly
MVHITLEISVNLRIIHEASYELRTCTRDPVFDGYKTKDQEKVHAQVKALYLALFRHELKWALDKRDCLFKPIESQRLRTPREVFEERLVNCIELAVAFSCLLMKIGLNPLITVVGPTDSDQPTHAILGYRLKDQPFPSVMVGWPTVKSDIDSITFFETTGVLFGSDIPFEDACADALQSLPLDVRRYDIPLPDAVGNRVNKFLSNYPDFKVFYVVDVRQMQEINNPYIIAITGAKGGTGKTVVTTCMAELIAIAKSNVLVIDFDIKHAGSTIFHHARNSTTHSLTPCKTVHDYLWHEDYQINQSPWCVTPSYLEDKGFGKIYLLPARPLVETITTNQNESLGIDEKIGNMLKYCRTFEISCVIIDCADEPSFLVSVASQYANKRFVITTPECICIDYMIRIRTDTTKIILNQVTSEADKLRCAFLNPVGYIPYNPDLRKHFSAGSLYFGLGYYDDVFFAIHKILEKTLQGTEMEKSLVPDKNLQTLGANRSLLSILAPPKQRRMRKRLHQMIERGTDKESINQLVRSLAQQTGKVTREGRLEQVSYSFRASLSSQVEKKAPKWFRDILQEAVEEEKEKRRRTRAASFE